MEASTLFNLAQIFGFRSGMVCTVFANWITSEFITNEFKHDAEVNCVKTAINGLKILEKMDQMKKQQQLLHWSPNLVLDKDFDLL